MTENYPPNTDYQVPSEMGQQPAAGAVFDMQEGSFDIMRYLQVLYIHKWKFIAIALLITIIALIYALNQPKFYVAEYEVFYNESIKNFVIESNVPVIKSDFDKSFWLSTMKSDEMARLTLLNSGLPYNTAIIKRMFKVEMVDKKEQSTPVYKVTVTSKNNTIIPTLIKAYVQALNDILLKNQVNNSDKLVTFLARQLSENNVKLSQIDQRMLLDGASNPAMIRDIKKLGTDLETFRTDLLNTQINLSSAMASKQRTEQELKNLDGTIVNESAFSEPLKVQLMNLQVDLARALTKNKESHPAIKAIRDNISQINGMLRDSIQQKLEIKSLVQNPLKAQLMSKLMELQITEISLQTRVLSLQNVISEFEGKMMPDTTDENQQQQLRNRELVFMTINLLNSKLIEAQSAAQGSLSRFVMIDEPEVPMAAANKSTMLILLMGLMAGLFLGAAAVFILDLLDNRLMLVSDFEKFYSFPLLGTLLHRRNPESYYEDHKPGEVSYKRMNELGEIIVNIKQAIKDPGKKLFSVCSPVRKEGKSMVSLQLATALANKGLNVLLVDMDMFIPKLTDKMGMRNAAGLVNFCKGENMLEEIIYPTDTAKLSFTGVGNKASRHDFQYDDPNFINFTKAVKQKFDIVIFDTPAVLYIPDIVTFLDLMDSVVIIVRLMHTTRKSLDKLIKMMGRDKIKIVGTIINDLKLNKINRHTNYYHYGYEYAYNESGDRVKKHKKIGVEHSRVA